MRYRALLAGAVAGIVGAWAAIKLGFRPYAFICGELAFIRDCRALRREYAS